MKALNKGINAVEKFVISFDCILLVMISVIVVVQVVARKLDISMNGTEELARYAYVIFAFLAWPIAAVRGNDIAITFLFDKLPAAGRKYLLIVFHVLMAIYAAICVYSMTLNIENAAGVVAVNNRWLHLSWVYSIVFVGLVATVIGHFVRIFLLATNQVVYVSQEEKDLAEIEAAKAAYDAQLAAEEAAKHNAEAASDETEKGGGE